jgi:Protein of unknown function (DUF3365)
MIRLTFFLLVLTLAPTASLRSDEAPEAWVVQSRAMADRLGGELKAELGRAMKDGGPVAAISVCRTQAPAIAARLSQESGAIVSRTALRVRNPANAPDPMQRDVLEQFATEMASGEAPAPLEAVFEMRRGDSIERRYMRAIPMDTQCVACHGAQVAPEIAAAIARDYPTDQATGFEPGQLRGAISVRWPGPSAPAATH